MERYMVPTGEAQQFVNCVRMAIELRTIRLSLEELAVIAPAVCGMHDEDELADCITDTLKVAHAAIGVIVEKITEYSESELRKHGRQRKPDQEPTPKTET